MATLNIKKGLLGREDISRGTGTVSRVKSDGTSQTITKVNLWEDNIFVVTSYGAKGDGATDDTAAIQAAIDAAEAAGGDEVFFPAGEYKVTSTLIVHEPTVSSVRRALVLRGVGSASRIKSTVATGTWTIDFQGTSDTGGMEMEATGLESLRIIGDATTANQNGVQMQYITRIPICRDLYIEQFTGKHLRLHEVTNANIQDVYCVGGGSGIGTYGFEITNANQVTLRNIYAQNMANTAYGLWADNIDGLAIYGGTFEQVKYGVYLDGAQSGIGGVHLSNIYTERLYEDSANTAVGIYVGGDAANPVKNVVITGGHVLAGISGGGNGRACIVVDNADHVTLDRVGLGTSFKDVEITTNATNVSATAGANMTLVGTNAAEVHRLDLPDTTLITTAPPTLITFTNRTSSVAATDVAVNDHGDVRRVTGVYIQARVTVNTPGASGDVTLTFKAKGGHADSRQIWTIHDSDQIAGDIKYRTFWVPVDSTENINYAWTFTGASWDLDLLVRQLGASYV